MNFIPGNPETYSKEDFINFFLSGIWVLPIWNCISLSGLISDFRSSPYLAVASGFFSFHSAPCLLISTVLVSAVFSPFSSLLFHNILPLSFLFLLHFSPSLLFIHYAGWLVWLLFRFSLCLWNSEVLLYSMFSLFIFVLFKKKSYFLFILLPEAGSLYIISILENS